MASPPGDKIVPAALLRAHRKSAEASARSRDQHSTNTESARAHDWRITSSRGAPITSANCCASVSIGGVASAARAATRMSRESHPRFCSTTHSAGSSSPSAIPANCRNAWCAANCARSDKQSRAPSCGIDVSGTARIVISAAYANGSFAVSAARDDTRAPSSHGNVECRRVAIRSRGHAKSRSDTLASSPARREPPFMAIWAE